MPKRVQKPLFHKAIPRVTAGVTSFLIIVLITALNPHAHAQQASRDRSRAPATLSPDEIFKRYRDAVVRLEVFLHGASLGVGSGFLISDAGEIATSLHVVRPLLAHPETTLQLKFANGKSLESIKNAIKIGACGDARGTDLCLLKIEREANAPAFITLPLATAEASPGESIVAIGHPRGLDFSISTGIISALRTHTSGWKEVQIDAAISPGNSGGPIINRHGHAIGVVYQFERDGQNLNFGILAPEVQTLLKAKQPYLNVPSARKAYQDQVRRLARRATDQWITPFVQNFTPTTASQSSAKNMKNMKWMRANFADTSFQILMPEIFQNCERMPEAPDASATSCSSANGDTVVTLQKRKRTTTESLTKYRGQRLVAPRPLAIVDQLETMGLWEDLRPHRVSFLSRPTAARCSKSSPAAGGFFKNTSGVCRFETFNDGEPGAASASLWLELGSDLYGVNAWSVEPGRLQFLQGLANLILVSAGRTGEDSPKLYQAQFRPSLTRKASRRNSAFSEADILDSYSDQTSVVTIVRTGAIPPSRMNSQFQTWSRAVAVSNLPQSSQEILTTDIANAPGRVGTWIIPNPENKRQSALFMMAVSFQQNETWIIYEIQPLQQMAGGRTPSNSLVSDMDRFRSWVKTFRPTGK
jgi:hypothetical protein